MHAHEWISDVLADLGSYCQKNDLTSTKVLVDQAKRALWMDMMRLGIVPGDNMPFANSPNPPKKIVQLDEKSPVG